ncbi:MAG: (d)CMP kinase [Saprospiraceae bacterium]|nr:(d)CMP kinase [Saprospiraceae bacterium]MBK6667494.1 (d)CMP kinase [Saprospiraceae bacterium]MBK8825126.1 (d)CMP kinase [Saprospiraceae bacterium]HQV65815.1 (d)CMP kinase [Saprospiraceae bacterium]
MEDETPNKPFIIAIDGFSSCGKSTLAKQIAKELDYIFVDTGAMYRATALFFIRSEVNLNDVSQINEALEAMTISFKNIDGNNVTFLNGENVESEIRSLEISGMVSEVAAIPAVRRKMVALQRNMTDADGVVMDGRDIGTVVFPDADVKFFVTADPLIRAQRRYNEMVAKEEHPDIQEIISNLAHRDHIDSTRDDSPLRQAEDAILLDNTTLTKDEQFELALSFIRQKMDVIP